MFYKVILILVLIIRVILVLVFISYYIPKLRSNSILLSKVYYSLR